MRVVRPSPPLAPFVRELMFVDADETATRVRLPEPGLVLGVRYRGSASAIADGIAARLPDAVLTGVSNRARRLRTEAGSGILLARFRPGGAAEFFGAPMHELFGRAAPLEDLVPRREVEELRAEVSEASSDGERVRAMEAFLLARRRWGTDDLVDAAVRAIVDARGRVEIRALAKQLATSQDPLEKRFRRRVGASPKQLASLVQLWTAVDGYREGARISEVAQSAGYFDQAHFTRAFRAVTGESPGRFLRAGWHT